MAIHIDGNMDGPDEFPCRECDGLGAKLTGQEKRDTGKIASDVLG